MYSLTEIIHTGNPKYLQYFSKKTGFLITDFKSTNNANLQWLWKHIAKNFNFINDFSKLNYTEKQKLGEILNNFGCLPQSDKTCDEMEKKLPWVFIHPVSGIFIPLEIVKLLMQEETFFRENYLFSLLYKLKIKEQKYFTSFIGSSLDAKVNLSFESSPLDMALVLYIWLSEQIRAITDIRNIIPERGKILKSPFTFAREINMDSIASVNNASTLIPEKPVPIWDYLYLHFSHLKEDIDKLHTLVTRGNKGFYRSVSLLKNQNSDLIRAFKGGILIPVLVSTGKSSPIKLVSPVELHYTLKNNQVKNSTIVNELLGSRRDPS
ncbi:MAG: hypothetical protein OEV78_05340 [Spirochaetia bacterium]|nr:hypothetical protein [Spirochaetia bacterium]